MKQMAKVEGVLFLATILLCGVIYVDERIKDRRKRKREEKELNDWFSSIWTENKEEKEA